jgi:outer membrane biosynthesis protein TonB
MRKANILTTAALFLLAPLAFTQDSALQPSPVLPGDILGPQLIVWSQAQKPQPVPQPLPPPESSAQQPANQPDQQQPGEPVSSQSQSSQTQTQMAAPSQPTAQAFTGTIVKDSGKYMLKVSQGSAYQIDDQEKVKPFEGKQVKIAGSLDANSNTLHVTSIEAML